MREAETTIVAPPQAEESKNDVHVPPVEEMKKDSFSVEAALQTPSPAPAQPKTAKKDTKGKKKKRITPKIKVGMVKKPEQPVK